MLQLIISLLLIVAAASEAFDAGNFTRISNRNPLLSRKKRYLTFPAGSNLGMTIALSVHLMRLQPRGWNIAEEMDFPFPLPSDTMDILKLKKKVLRRNQKRDIFDGFHSGFNQMGLNGTACVKRLWCDSKELVNNTKRKSMVKEMIAAIFRHEEEDDIDCNRELLSFCDIPILGYIIKSLTN